MCGGAGRDAPKCVNALEARASKTVVPGVPILSNIRNDPEGNP
jgi:hypothetical protein